MTKQNMIRIVDTLGLTWCLCILMVSVLWGNYLTAGVVFVSANEKFLAVVFCTAIGIAVSYMPMVFLGIAPIVIIQAVINGRESKLLRIPTDVWHGDSFFLLAGRAKSTLCAHCWCVPGRLILSLALWPISIIIGIGILLFRSISLIAYVSVKLLFGRRRDYGFSMIEVIMDPNNKFSYLFEKKIAKHAQPLSKTTSQPSLVWVCWEKAWDILLQLKDRVCPIIHWQ